MKKTSTVLLLILVLGLTLSFVPASAPARTVQAQESGAQAAYYSYLPYFENYQLIRVEHFERDPGWPDARIKDPTDGYFEHSPETETLLGHVTDNAAMIVTWPGWRVRGDYKVAVTARHVGPMHKSFNGLGVVFNATDDFDHYYALMLAMGAAQNFWALVRFKDTRAHYETNGGYRGGPGFMKDWDGWNRLEVRVIDGQIDVYCNGKWLPNGSAEGTYLADNRLVGLVATSYEFDEAEIEFDDFKLKPLYPGDPEYDEVIQMREARAKLKEIEFDTPALDLH
jgi:hypothetical protein